MESRRLYDDIPVQEEFFADEPFEIGEADENERGGRASSLNRADDVPPWSPSGSFWKDAWYFVGPGWLVSIAYIDPGNYQADITAGGTSR